MRPKPKPTKGERKPTKSQLKKKAHFLLREIVMLRDKKCVCPPPVKGHSSILQAGHIIPGTKSGTYFDLYNVHLQCKNCNGRHVFYESYYVSWFVRKFGEREYLRLSEDCDKDFLKSSQLENIIVQLELILQRMERDKNFIPYFSQKEIISGSWSVSKG